MSSRSYPGDVANTGLPACSPELNPAQWLWRELRRQCLSNRAYADIEAFDEAVATAWLKLTRDAPAHAAGSFSLDSIRSGDLCPELFEMDRIFALAAGANLALRYRHL